MSIIKINIFNLSLILIFLFFSQNSYSQDQAILDILEEIKKDLKTLEKAVYSDQEFTSSSSVTEIDQNTEDVLTRHLLKLSELENQFNELTNKFERINFKLDKLANRLSKIQADNQLRFLEIEEGKDNISTTDTTDTTDNKELASKIEDDENKMLPGSSEPQDLGSISYKDTSTDETTQQTQSIETTSIVVTEEIEPEEKILPDESADKQYDFAFSFMKVGDYNTAERAFLEFIKLNKEHELAGNAQYWYAETFRIRQLYTDAASAYLEGYEKYPKSSKAPINLLKLGVSLVQIGEKDQGCLMISGVKEQYPKASQSVLQKAKYEEKKFGCKKDNT